MIIRILYATIAALLLAGFAAPRTAERLSNITCSGLLNYEAFVYAEGLSGPDGLAIGPDNTLYVAEETAGRVSRVEASGNTTVVLPGLRSPEGITVAPDGTLYAVEDVANGRLRALAPNGTATTITDTLTFPEGVAWANGRVYVTESNVETIGKDLLKLKSWVTEISAEGQRRSGEQIWRSYAGITVGSDGKLYMTNEISGASSNGFTVRDSVYRGEFASQSPFAQDLVSPEGLRFAPGGGFPLYVAEESFDNQGSIRMLDASGSVIAACEGFGSIEDVVFNQSGDMFVSEDASGRILRLVRVASPTPVPTAFSTVTPLPALSPTPIRPPNSVWIPLVEAGAR